MVEIDDFKPTANIYPVGILSSTDDIGIEDEVVVVHNGEIRGVGGSKMPSIAMRELKKGVAVKMLESVLNKKVALLLKDNRTLEGSLIGYDAYMNLVLDDVEEKAQEVNRKLGVVIVRGSNVVRMVPI